MKFLIKTQLLAIIVSLIWILFISMLAFLDQPERAMQYINSFVYGFGILFAIICIILAKKMLGHNWLGLPLVLIPYLFIYQPVFQQLLQGITSRGNADIIRFLLLSTGSINLLAVLFGIVIGIMFSRSNK